MLRDERLRKQFQQHLAEQGDTPPRPELAGFTREVNELHKVNTTLTHLVRVMSKNMAIPLPEGPIYPSEQWAMEQSEAELADLDSDIAGAMKPLALKRKRR